MTANERQTVEAEFVSLAKAMLACIVRLAAGAQASAPQRAPEPAAQAALAPLPEIPDAPASPAAAPPAAPDVPDTPEVGAQPTDAEFLTGLEGLFNQCASEAEVAKHATANQAEVGARGLQQAAGDLAERRCARIREIRAQAEASAVADGLSVARDEYIRLVKALRFLGTNGTIAQLQQLWAREQRALKMLPENWQTQLTAEKDKVKAQLQQKEAA
jgi:hypothetical protein